MTTGSMTSVPVVLALLIWMVELVLCVEHLQNRAREAQEEERQKSSEELFAEWVLQSYESYFFKREDDKEQLIEAIQQLFSTFFFLVRFL